MLSAIGRGGPRGSRIVKARGAGKAGAIALAAVLGSGTASLAVECRLGLAVFDAPACDIAQVEHFDGQARYVQWEADGTLYQVTAVALEKRRTFKGYLGRWRHSHKCSAVEIPVSDPVRLTGPGGAQGGTPPQVSWSGNCAACSSYFVRAIGFEGLVVELHAGRYCSRERTGGFPPLELAFARLLNGVRFFADR